MAERARASSPGVVALWILAILGTLFFLRTARDLLIPIALAVLISYALEPVVAWLERQRIPRLAGASVVMLVILGLVSWGGYALRDDAGQLMQAAPNAIEKAREKVMSQLGSAGSARATDQRSAEDDRSRGTQRERAVATKGTSDRGSSGQGLKLTEGGSLAQRAGAAVFSLAAHLVIIFFLVFFLLISGHRMRDRLVEISGPDPARRRIAATIIRDINRQIQRYLLVLLFTAGIVAAATWTVLAWLGVEHAATWGILAGVFNSIPYFGPVIVSGGLLVVGLVQGGGITQGLQMAGAALIITSLEGWLLTPPLMGKAERMGEERYSPFRCWWS